MVSARDALNALRWTTGLAGVTLTYLHRGAPGDERTVRADEVAVGRGGFDVAAKPGESGSIPWHRALRIERDGEVLWTRAPR